jgi:hypothetical protein
MPRSGKVLIGPPAEAFRPLIVVSLKKRSTYHLMLKTASAAPRPAVITFNFTDHFRAAA